MSGLGFVDAIAAAALGVPAGPIRLQVGIPGANGFGEAHITTNERRMRQLADLGYQSAISFVRDVASNWTKIAHGAGGRLILIFSKSGYDLRIVVQLAGQATDPFWSVTTAIPSRVCRETIAYTRATTP